MPGLIISDNIYFRIALSELMNKSNDWKWMCVIDLDCCKSLDELLIIFTNCEEKGYEIFLSGSRGIYFELFSGFNIIDVNLPIEKVELFFRQCNGLSPTHLIEHISSCRSLAKLNTLQINICHLDRNKKISVAPFLLNLTLSSIYRNINLAASRLHFQSLLNFRYFIMKEISNEDFEGLLCSHPLYSLSINHNRKKDE